MAGDEQERGREEGYEVRVSKEPESQRQTSSRFNGHQNPGDCCQSVDLGLVDPEWGLGFCISNFPQVCRPCSE